MSASDITARDPSAAPDFAPSASEAPERASISASNNSQNSGAPIQIANSTAATAATSTSAIATESKLEVGTPAVTHHATVPAEASSSNSSPSNGATSGNCTCKVPHLNSRKRDSKKKKRKVTHKLSRIVSESSDTDDSSSISSLSTLISTNGDASEFDPTEPSFSESESDGDSDAVNGSKATKRNQKTKAKLKKTLKKTLKKKKSLDSHRVVTDSNSDTSAEYESDSPIDEKKLERVLTKVLARHTATIAPKEATNENLQQQADILARLLAIASVTGTGNADAVNGNPGSKKPNAHHASPTNGQATDNGFDLPELKSKEKKKTKKATKVEFKRVDQLWDNNIHKYRLTETIDDPSTDEWDQYIFTVRRRFDWQNKYVETMVNIKSKYLRNALATIMDGVKGISLVQETAIVDPNMLFLYLEEIHQCLKDLKNLSKTETKKKARKVARTKAAHLKVLVKYLDTDYAETKDTLYPLLKANMITFDLLWALFKPNTIAYAPTYGVSDEPRAFKIEYVTKVSNIMKGHSYNVEGRCLDYDGKSFGMGTIFTELPAFKGVRKITSLACYPLQYHREADKLKEALIERGKKYVSLKGMNYRFHQGMAFYQKKQAIIKVNVNGRVMVDPAIHHRMNPNYHESEFTRRPKYKTIVDKGGRAHFVKIDDDGNPIVEKGKATSVDEEELQAATEPSERTFTEEELLIASPVVLGFAFSEKLWLEFTVSGIREIEWNDSAFDSLVLPDNQKSIVKALVESHTFNPAQNVDDVIQGKGRGLVAVLHGPPGTGKTLTAESIAELLRRPLYMVSAGELGIDSRTLEFELNKILDIAHSWGALLLLDEADVFLEKRSIHDINRNALVSVFLRLLEYFQGIIFLTTNRVETFDDAFQSRIHVALRYGDLGIKAKRSVWKMFLERVQALEGLETLRFTEKDFESLARHNLNGRQIKNSVRAAQALAINEKKPLSMEQIKRVLEVAETFDRDLRGGTGYLDAMRSYT